MTSAERTPASAPPASGAGGYWVESRQPLASLVFIAPLLVAYELGVLLLGPEAVNGADVWMRRWLALLGFGQYFLLPAITVCTLLGWHYTTRHPWRISSGLLSGMLGECILLALCLRLLVFLQAMVMQIAAAPIATLDATATRAADFPGAEAYQELVLRLITRVVGFLGAGIYEELLFRLILLTAAIGVLKRCRLGPKRGTLAAVLLVSSLFAAAHHVGTYGEPFEPFSFMFRVLAGAFFCVLFLYRGFGITAGAHAGYNMLVGLVP